MRENIDDHDVESLVRIARELDVRFKADRIWLKGEDVSLALRHESVGNQASAIAVHGAVREALHARQRAFLEAPGLDHFSVVDSLRDPDSGLVKRLLATMALAFAT